MERNNKGQFYKGGNLGHKVFGGFNTTFKKGHKDLVPKEKREKPSGELSWFWKGGISKIDKLCRRMKEYFQWRSDVFTRDKWTCMTCGINGVYLTVHHIVGFSKIIKEENIKNISDAQKCSRLWDITNGITLCEDCHKLTDNYKGRAKSK